MNVVVRLLTALLASLIGWIGFAGTAAAGSALTAPPGTYTYDHPGNPRALSFSTTKRGPLATYNHATTYDAIDRGSHDASARLHGSTPPALFAFDHLGPRAQGASGEPGTTLTGVRADEGRLSALERSQVATKAVPASNKIYSARALERMAGQPGPMHNFPGSFDDEIFTSGTRTVSSRGTSRA